MLSDKCRRMGTDRPPHASLGVYVFGRSFLYYHGSHSTPGVECQRLRCWARCEESFHRRLVFLRLPAEVVCPFRKVVHRINGIALRPNVIDRVMFVVHLFEIKDRQPKSMLVIDDTTDICKVRL